MPSRTILRLGMTISTILLTPNGNSTMNNYFSMQTVKTVLSHLPEKLAASAGITGILSALGIHAQLVLIFALLEALDIVTALIAASAKCWHAIYPQTPGTLWDFWVFRTQARKWRYIQSNIMRKKSVSKLCTYGIMLLFCAFADTAMQIAGSPRFLLSIFTCILCLTETISVCENLDAAGYDAVHQLLEIVKARKDKIK